MVANLSVTFDLTDNDVNRINEAIKVMKEIEDELSKAGFFVTSETEAMDDAITVLNNVLNGVPM